MDFWESKEKLAFLRTELGVGGPDACPAAHRHPTSPGRTAAPTSRGVQGTGTVLASGFPWYLLPKTRRDRLDVPTVTDIF